MQFYLTPSEFADLVEVAVEDGGGHGAEEADDVTQAEPGPEHGVVSLGVGRRAYNYYQYMSYYHITFIINGSWEASCSQDYCALSHCSIGNTNTSLQKTIVKERLMQHKLKMKIT